VVYTLARELFNVYCGCLVNVFRVGQWRQRARIKHGRQVIAWDGSESPDNVYSAPIAETKRRLAFKHAPHCLIAKLKPAGGFNINYYQARPDETNVKQCVTFACEP
jgi:hypothetical protein